MGNRYGRFGKRKSARFGEPRDSRRDGGSFRRNDERRSEKRFGRKDTEMFEVTCDKCGRDCEVPFKPTGGKPVYCSECFKKSDNSNSKRSSSGGLEEINRKLDKIMEALDIK
jgi:CxxC-x17-CxxC domain-containing protein